jgi:Ulp1 family protease
MERLVGIQRKDIERLGEGESLGDEIINSCTEAITREANPKVFMMNSLKFASLEKAIPTGRLRLGKYHTRLAESRYFVVPVHQGGNHWSLGIIISDDRDKPQATVLTVDSLDTYGNKANRGISRSLKSLLRLERGEGYPVHWLHAKNIQQQTNGCDCGVFVLMYLADFAQNPDDFVRRIK